MKADRLGGFKLVGALSREAAHSLARGGQIALGLIAGSTPPASRLGCERRVHPRRRTRFRSAKILDGAKAFVCEAIIQDRSVAGIRLLLARNVGLPTRFGLHDDETGDVMTVTAIWRRGQTLGVRVLQTVAAAKLAPSERVALGSRYYGMRE